MTPWAVVGLAGLAASVWILPKTEIDNLLGTFGQALLKSSKMEHDDPALYEDIRQTFTWRNPPK